jgi:hypothetical protein
MLEVDDKLWIGKDLKILAYLEHFLGRNEESPEKRHRNLSLGRKSEAKTSRIWNSSAYCSAVKFCELYGFGRRRYLSIFKYYPVIRRADICTV